MGSRIHLERRGTVTDLDDLFEVDRQKCRDGAILLVLIDVTQFVGQKTTRFMPAADEDRMPQRKAGRARAK